MSKAHIGLAGACALCLGILIGACDLHGNSGSASPAVSPTPAATTASSASSHNSAPRISVDELKNLLAEKKPIVIVDVRSVDAYNIGHIKGSINVPLEKIEKGELSLIPRDKRIVTYCSCPAENSSGMAAEALAKAGYTDLGVLVGGTHAWEKSGGEMEKGGPKANS